MIREWVQDVASSGGAMLALVLFVVVFVGVLAWIFRPGSRRVYDRAARLPLENNEQPGGTAGKAEETDNGQRAG